MTRPDVLDRIGDGLVAGIPLVVRRRRRRQRVLGAAVGLVFVAGGSWLAAQQLADDDGETVIADGPALEDSSPTADVIGRAQTTEQGRIEASPFEGIEALDPVIGGGDVFFIGRTFDEGPIVAYALSLDTGMWRQLPDPPVSFGQSPAIVWADDELIVCCGGGPGTNGTAAFDPASDTWRPLADSPLSSYSDAVWTGEVMFVVDSQGFASFDPVTEMWTSLATPPDLAGWPAELEWTGERLFVWPRPGARVAPIGSEYDPETDSWEQLPAADMAVPGMASAAWVNGELFVFGGLPAPMADDSERLVGLRWDGQEWSEVPDPLPEPNGCECNLGSQTVLVVDERILVHGGFLSSSVGPYGALLSFDPSANEWHEIGSEFDTALVPLATDGESIVFRRNDGAITVVAASTIGDEGQEAEPTPTPTGGDQRPLRPMLFALPDWLRPRGGHTVTWTGTELIIWGGWSDESAKTTYADGAAYDPASDSWRPLAPSPLSGRAYHSAVWTGDRLLIVGGQTQAGVVVDDGAAYDPSTDTWSAIAATGVTHEPTTPPSVEAVWTGQELVLWYRDQDVVRAFDPAQGTWSNLPDLNLAGAHQLGALHWTGAELIALAGEGPGAMSAAMLRPNTDNQWTELPPVEFVRPGFSSDPFPSNSAVADGQLVVWSRSGRDAPTFVLDTGNQVWTEILTVPINPCEGHFEPVSLGSRILVMDTCVNEDAGGAALYDAATRSWEVLQAGPDGRADLGKAVWTGSEVLVVETTCCYGTGNQPFEWAGVRYTLD
jgi:hypothetical protein